jgi:predicted metal-dependent hydrolase
MQSRQDRFRHNPVKENRIKRELLKVEHGTGRNSLFLSGNKAILTVRKESAAGQRDKFIREWYRGVLKKEIEPLLPKWEERTGIRCNSWQTKYMTTRRGTCNIGLVSGHLAQSSY